MNDQARDSEPPDEPYLRAELSIQSPASPKPLPFPQPTNIPVLENMMDVGFNQTELHMSDPAMHQTELRPDAWRDPNDQPSTTAAPDQPSLYPTGRDATEQSLTNADAVQQPEGDPDTAIIHHSNEAAPNGHDTHQPISLSNDASYEANSHLPTDVANEPTTTNAPLPSSDPSVPSAESEHEPAPIADAAPTQSNAVHPDQSQQTPAPGAVDVQALLDTLQTSLAPSANATPAAQGDATSSQSQVQPSIPGTETSPLSASGLGAPPSGLPPRPPPQDQPLINPNYVHSQHIRDYHPHAAHPAVQGPSHGPSNSPGNADLAQAQQAAANTAPNGQATGAAPPTHQAGQGTAGQQPQYPASNTPMESRREYKIAAGQTPTKEDQPWTADIQKKYDHFMEEERRYVNEARWDQFPVGSRLFVGNLSSEKVTKRDIFHVFHTYGELAQISIKQAYGFVQFLHKEGCSRALQAEQGRQIRDKRIHLEISKPQKSNNKNQQQQNSNNRRSRSPDYNRGRPGNNDRYGGRGANGRGRDGYRGGYRSPSPPPPPRGYRDRYEERYRTRSRSPEYGRYRGSPPRETEDDLPLPRRQPRDVPEVQIIALDQLDRDFLSWVEKAFTNRGVRVDVLILSPRLSEEAVMRRQIMEGVVAVSKLRRANQHSSKIGLTIFKRKHGTRDVQFEDYDNLDPHICAELVLREKSTQGGGAASAGGYSGQYGQAQYGYQPPAAAAPTPFAPPTGYPPGYGQQQPPAAYGVQPPQAPPLATNMDPNNLQNLLSTLNQPSPNTPQTAGPYGHHPAQSPFPPNAQQYGAAHPQQQHDPYAALRNNPALAGMMQQPPPHSQGPAQGQPPGPNMQDILARLGTYRQ
ncbi:uncharacterized RNA-binding -like [Lecanosticta acicola]|uniref:Uncharacterized RNA-binding -like n=1 Tax=Lecanosticta acicola TaxID=111012 RepID=A0AAI8Z8U9_9PEZI|nr:uncharacterized RNA-binding -like [Lecanosticta acicola]